MAIEIIESITLPSGTYTFNCPDWLKSYLRNYPTSMYSSGNSAISESYTMYNTQICTFPFSYTQYYSSYSPGNPSNTTLQTGVSGNYLHWENPGAGSSTCTSMEIFINNSSIGGVSGGGNTYNRWTWYFGIDESTQKGYCWRVHNYGTFGNQPNQNNTGLDVHGYSTGGTLALYNFIKGIVTPVSTWENYPITGMSTGVFTGNMDAPTWSSDYSSFAVSITPAQVAAMSTPSSPYEYAILGNLTTGLIMQRNGGSTVTFVRFLLRYNGTNCLRGWGTNGTYFMSNSDGHYVTFFFAINDETERGTYSCVFTENNQQFFNEFTWNYCANSYEAYLAIKSLVPVSTWRNITEPLSATGIPQNIISDPSGFITAWNNATTGQAKDAVYTQYIFPTWNGVNTQTILEGKILGDTNNYINLNYGQYGNYLIKTYYNGSEFNWTQDGWRSNDDYTICYVALVNDTEQLGFFSGFIRYRQNQACGTCSGAQPGTSGTNAQKFYTILTAIPPTPTINWHSVQSITGNGLTIPLVTLKSDSINGGDPVSNGTISSFTNQPSNDNNVKYLVDLSISAVSNDITVDYTIPTITKGSYISVKLFGKIGELPACNEDDDVIEDLDPIESSKDIYSLPGGTYYFCIRTITSDGLKLTSNALSVTIADPVPEDLKPYVKLINDITGYTYDRMGGFTMYDYTIASDGTNLNYDPYCRNYSWRNQHWAGPGQSQPVITDSNFDTATILPMGIMDVNVDTSTFTITSNTVASPMIFSTRYQQYGHRYYQGSYFHGYPCSSNSINIGTYSSTIGTQGYNNGDTSVSFSSQYLATTFDCVKWVAQNFRNINLYVDGVLWSKANNTN